MIPTEQETNEALSTPKSQVDKLLTADIIKAIKDARDCMRYMTPYKSGETEEDVCNVESATFTKRRKQIRILDNFLGS